MPVTPADVREILPSQAQSEAGFPTSLLNASIAAWQARADAATGGISADENPAIFEAIRIGAASSAYTFLYRGQSTDEPGMAKTLREQAEALIKTIDVLTSGVNEPDVLSANLVSNMFEKPLWD
jgi:hypothetical protein